MKRMFSRILAVLLILTLFAAQAAFAEDELLKGIFEQLVSEDSAYSRNKAEEMGYLPGCTFTETFAGDSFTISIQGGSFGDGTYTFVRNGDYVTFRGDIYDYYPTEPALDLLKAAETPEYTVILDPDEDTVRGILEDPPEGYCYAVVQFGSAE